MRERARRGCGGRRRCGGPQEAPQRRRRGSAAKTRATPAARKAAQQKAVSISQSVKGSGDAGRVMRRDVEAASAPATAAGRRRSVGSGAARRCASAGGQPRRRHRRSSAGAGRAHRRARPHVEAARDDRQAPDRGAEHGRDAHHLQRGGHVGRPGDARAPQGIVQGTARRQPRHDVVLRQGRRRRAARVPPDQRRDPGRRDGAEALLRHRHRGRRERRAGRAGAARRRPDVVRRDRGADPRRSPRRPRTARCRSPT